MRGRRPLVGVSILALTASAIVVAVPATADDLAVPDGHELVIANDFEDDSWAPWEQSGTPTLSVIEVDGSKVLSVADRAEDFDGIETPAGLLEGDTEYTASMRVRLADGTTGSPSVRWVVKPGFGWQGATTMDADGWTAVTATFVTPDDPEPSIYIGTDDLPEGPYTYLIDEIVISTPAAVDEVVWSLDFDDDSHAPWANNGGTLSFVDADDGKALSIERTENWHGIKSPTGVLQHDVAYTFSMRARLPEGTAGQREVRFVVEPGFDWVANTTIDGDGWTEISGTYLLPAGVDPDETAIYIGTSGDDGEAWTLLIDDLLVTAPAGSLPIPEVDLSFDFEDGTLQGWVPRATAMGTPTVAVTDEESHGGDFAALVSDRTDQGSGIGFDLSEHFVVGGTYEINAFVKMAQGASSDNIWLSVQTGPSDFAGGIAQVPDVSADVWVEVEASYTYTGGDLAFLYFETSFTDGGTGSFLVDDITIRSQDDVEIEDLPSIWEFHEPHFPVGVAIDERETFGAAAELTTLHYNQVTAENHMKPEAFYDGPWNFRVHPQAFAVMDFARDNDLGVFGHVLVWHSQTPDWFFQHDDGTPLSDSPDDQELMRQRMRTHIFNIAAAFEDEYGPFGSDTNPLIGWDVVNEVVSDSTEFADGLRRSEWYRILGEEFIDLAFEYADEAFNDTYADPGSDRPVALFINDYNTEQGGKQNRYYALVERLLDRGVALDGVGHQFHVSLSMPVSALEAAIVRFQDFADDGIVQAVTEMDVTVGTPVTEPNIIEQGFYYRDAFEVFRDYADDLFSVTLWGLTDGRSWRSAQAPLPFDANLQAKPAYHGIMDADLEPRIRTALVFHGQPPVDADAVDSVEWRKLPLHRVEDDAGFQLRWSSDLLTAYVEVADDTTDASDGLAFHYEGEVVEVGRDGSATGAGDVEVAEVEDGYVVLAQLPLPDEVDEGATLAFNLLVTDGDQTASWGDDGDMGTLTLVEPLSFVEVVEAPTAPDIDGDIDEVWELANAVTTDKVTGGDESAAAAEVRTLWQGNTLFVLAEVTDDQIDTSGSDPWVQDSLEIFLDAGNLKNGPYRFDDTQIRINVDNELSFGTGDEAFQQARVQSATSLTDDGYLIEAAIDLLEYGGAGTFHGLDFQVNDGTDGVRTGIRNWADPTTFGWQSTSRWGVAKLIEADDPGEPVDPCDTTISGRHNGPLFATSGLTCVEEGASIRGGVWVGPKAGLVIEGGDVRGGVTAIKASRLEIRDSTVAGGIASWWARGPIVLDGNDVRGGVTVKFSFTPPDRPVISGNTIRGPLLCLGNLPPPTNAGVANHTTGGGWWWIWWFDQCRWL